VQREADSDAIGGTMALRAATLGLRVARAGALGVACAVVVDRASAQEPECTPSLPPGAHPRQEDISASSNSEPAVDLDAWLAAQQDNRPQAAAPQTDAVALGTQHLFGNALLRDLERERQQRRQADRQAQELQQRQPVIPVADADDDSVQDLCSSDDDDPARRQAQVRQKRQPADDDSVEDLCSLPDDDTYVECPVDFDSDDDNVPVGLEPAPLTQGGKHDVTAPFFGTVNAFAAVVAADRLGVLEPGLDASEEQLEENCRRVEAEMVADTERKLPNYFENLAGNDVVGAARDLREETLKTVKEKQMTWTARGKLGQLSEQMMESYRRLLDALHEGARRWHKERVADGTHHFLAKNKIRTERNGKPTVNPHEDKDAAWKSYRDRKQKIKAMIDAGEALSPLQKALAKQFEEDDPGFARSGAAPRGTAPSGPVELVVDAKQLVESDAPIQVMEKVYKACGAGMRDFPNRRYEQTKGATTAKQFIDAGYNRTDLAYDVKKGYVKVLQGEIPKKRKQDHSKRGYWTEQQKDAMAARYLKILDEYQS
jgi:hypothetical protein